MASSRAVGALFVLLVSVPTRADSNNPNKSAAQEATRFAEFVAVGDRARLAHRNPDAFRAYSQALDIHRDPAVEGRLGLVMLDVGETAVAAEYLLTAITKAQAEPNLMQQFHDAFKRVRPKVCFVEVFVSQQKAQIFIDGRQERDSNQNAFHVFVTAGSHTFLAKLDGFEDAIEVTNIPAGGEFKVRLDLKPLPPPPPVQEEPTPKSDPKPVVPVKPHKSLFDSYLRFQLGAGAALMLGATPGVAIGSQISGGFRRGFFSLNADVRLAWATGTLETAQNMQFMTWAAGMRPCAHYAFLFGCGVLQASGMKSLAEDDRWQTRFGGGLHAGVDLLVRAPVHLQLWGEGVVLSNSYTIAKNGKGLWEGLPFSGGFGATALLTW